MNTCRTCRHWHYIELHQLGECDAIAVIQGQDVTGLYLYRIDGDAADFEINDRALTLPDFGCVHHAPIDADPMPPLSTADKVLLAVAFIVAWPITDWLGFAPQFP